MTIFEEFKREGELITENTNGHIWCESSDEFGDGVCYEIYDPEEEHGWRSTGWLLERLSEWEDVEEFAQYHGLVYDDFEGDEGRLSPFMVHLPTRWLTSPSILPTKIGEYIKWRDER